MHVLYIMKTIEEKVKEPHNLKKMQETLDNFDKMVALVRRYPVKPIKPVLPTPPYTIEKPYEY